MTGSGQIGPLLTAMGLKPVQFQSVSDFQKSITTESKMFSIGVPSHQEGAIAERRA